MGQLKSDGRAIDVVIPSSTAITKGEMYRIDGWTGIAMKTIASTDTDKNMAFEVSSERIWYVKLPAGVTGARGDRLYWTTGTGFKAALTDVQASAAGYACAIVEEAKDANDYAGVRVLNAG
jgi:Uncharacterized conserved protein (DUF2190)